jgi:hypothetical protein
MNITVTLDPPDKDYGRTKTGEPKTPYNYEIEDELDGLDVSLLTGKTQLGGSDPLKALHKRNTSETDSSDEEETPEEKAKRKSLREQKEGPLQRT